MIKLNIQFFADDDDINTSDYENLEHNHEWDDLSDHDIDDILGKENTDEEGLAESFLDDEADEPANPKVPQKKQVKSLRQNKKQGQTADRSVELTHTQMDDELYEDGLDDDEPNKGKDQGVEDQDFTNWSDITDQNKQNDFVNQKDVTPSDHFVNQTEPIYTSAIEAPDHAFHHDKLAGVVDSGFESVEHNTPFGTSDDDFVTYQASNENEFYQSNQPTNYWDRPTQSNTQQAEGLQSGWDATEEVTAKWDQAYSDEPFNGWDRQYANTAHTDHEMVNLAYAEPGFYDSREDQTITNSLVHMQEQPDLSGNTYSGTETAPIHNEDLSNSGDIPLGGYQDLPDTAYQQAESNIPPIPQAEHQTTFENSGDKVQTDQTDTGFQHDGLAGKHQDQMGTDNSFSLQGQNEQPENKNTKTAEQGHHPTHVEDTEEAAYYVNAKTFSNFKSGNISSSILHTAGDLSEGLGQTVYNNVDPGKSDDLATQGVNDLKNSVPVTTLQTMIGNAGANSTYSISKSRSSHIEAATIKAEEKIASGKASLESYKSFGVHHKAIADNLEAKAFFQKYANESGCRFSANERNFLKSNKFYSQKDLKMYNAMLTKAVRAYCPAAEHLDFSKLNKKQMKKLIKNPEKYGLSPEMVAAIRKGMRMNEHFRKKSAADGIRGRILKVKRLGVSLTKRVLSSDEATAGTLKAGSTAYRISAVTFKAARVTLKLAGKITHVSALTGKIKQGIHKKVIDPMKAKASKKVENAKNGAKQTAKKATDSAKKTARKFGETKVGKPFKQAYQGVSKVAGGIKKVAKPVGKATKKTAKVTAKVAKQALDIAKLPGQLLGKMFSILGKIKRWVLIIVGIIALFVVVARMILSFFAGLSDGANTIKTEMATDSLMDRITGVYENVISYDKYSEMREDVQNILDKDAEVMEQVLELANGTPKNNEVWDGHTIDHYGFPGNTNEDGEERLPYYIHYIDKDGNELLSQTTIAKDVESLAISIIRNDLGSYYSNSKDLKKLDAMLEEIYGLSIYIDPETGYPFKFRESEPEACFEGCEDYDWVCYDQSAYSEYSRERGEKVKFYGECENSLTPSYEDLGCEPIPGEEIYDEYGEPTGMYEEDRPGCPGHSCKRCFGHKYVEIYVILLDIDSVVDAYRNGSLVIDFDYQVSGEHEHIEDSSYRTKWDELLNDSEWSKMTKDFRETGAWDAEYAYERALSFKNPDPDKYGTWLDLYGIDPELGAGFGTSKGFTDEEIAEIVANMQFDGTVGADQQKILELAMSYVGKFKYRCDGSAHTNLYNGGSSGYSECSGFVSGILKEAGYDVSNFRCADLKSVSTKGGTLTPGCVVTRIDYGSKSNHTMIYAGDAGNGRSYVIDCSSDAGGSAYRTVSNSYLAQYQYTYYPWLSIIPPLT